MSDIDLKALRKTIGACIRTDRRFPVFTAADVLQLIDRIESAERRAEDAEEKLESLVATGIVGAIANDRLEIMQRMRVVPDAIKELIDASGKFAAMGDDAMERCIKDGAAELDALERDAARYRWLRDPGHDVALVLDKQTEYVSADESVPGVGGYYMYEYRAGVELDAAIDAAMAQEGGK